MEEEEGDGAGEGVADVEEGHGVEEEPLHLPVQLPWEGLELELSVLVSKKKKKERKQVVKMKSGHHLPRKNHQATHAVMSSYKRSIPRQ